MNNKKVLIVIGAIVVLCVIVFGGIALTQNVGKDERVIDAEKGAASVAQMASKVNPKTANLVKSPIEYTDDDSAADELPDIETMKVATEATTPTYAEIFAVSNVAGTGNNAWMADLAEQFNKTSPTVNGKPVSIKVRTVASGYAYDYITSGKAVPDAFCPSNDLWVLMLQANGVKTDNVRDSLVRDAAGVLLDSKHYDALLSKYGTIDMKAVTEAVAANELSFGYTNPFTSATGMNFLISTLLRYDPANPLSETAAAGFSDFQANVPLVALTTQQMVKAASNGSLDGFVNEHQVYMNDPSLQAQYKFVPFGYRHDYPLTAIGDISDEKAQILEMFAAYCDANGAELAEKDGFNSIDDYTPEMSPVDGQTLIATQKFYKKNKDSGNPVIAVFVADVSGSMSGQPLAALQSSLVNSMKYINTENYIGLISYSDDVTINLPIDQFDMEQQTYFKGAVESLKATGGTATFDGIVVAADMINKEMEKHPDAKPMIFVLSDGMSNRGYTLNDISGTMKALKIPIYTVGYNADIDALGQISDINEAASINADTDDVTYQLKTLFNANM